MKVAGRRVLAPLRWAGLMRLTRTAEAVRGTPHLLPRGVTRFHSFEEAQAWMMQAVADTHARLSRRTSRESRGR